MNIVIGIPTVGRAGILCETLTELALQTRAPDGIIVCGTAPADVAGIQDVAPHARVLLTAAGLPRQRNAILDAASDADAILFFDDDFLPHRDYVAAIAACMMRDASVMVATGAVLADGIKGPGLSPREGRARLVGGAVASGSGVTPVFSGYGCNMAVRMAPIRAQGLRFDERLQLYGWQEDVDFSRRLAAHGQVVQVQGARGVHLGSKSGRGSGVRLGYSQVANPLYLFGKKLGYPLPRAMTHIARNLAMNAMRASWAEPYVDRRGRLKGNLLAMRDLLAGRMVPERILEL